MVTTKPENLWIFGYGSLIWDGWEERFGCTRRSIAELSGYRRAFNKPSVQRWGSQAAPGPTLSLIKAPDAVCRGVAFAFPIAQAVPVRAYLVDREGRDFPLRERSIKLMDGGELVSALVPTYEGSKAFVASLDEVATMVCRAVASGGRCVDYVRNLGAELKRIGIDDAAVDELLTAVKAKERAG